jgi:hypothetical protein
MPSDTHRIQLLYSTTRKPFSALIRAVTWSRWSHVALIDGEHIIESVANGGVRQYPLEQAISLAADHCIVDLPARDPQAILDAARSQLGKPYDWTAILGLGLHRDWQKDDSWFCSELVAWAAAEVGEHWFRPEALRRVTPQHLWMLPPRQEPRLVTV